MDKISREYLKRLVAEHRLDDLIEELFQFLINYLSQKEDKQVSEIYDSLTLISGKLKNIRRQNIVNIIDSKDLALEYSRISHSLIFIINEIPESVLVNKLDIKKDKDSTAQENLKEIDLKDIITNAKEKTSQNEILGEIAIEYQKAIILSKSGDFEEASKILLKIINKNNNLWPAHLCIGHCYINLSLYHEAIEHLTLSAKYGKMLPLVHHNLGLAYYELGRETRSKYYFERAREYCLRTTFYSTHQLLKKIRAALNIGFFGRLFEPHSRYTYQILSEIPSWQSFINFEAAFGKVDTCSDCLTIEPKRCWQCSNCFICDGANENESYCQNCDARNTADAINPG